MATFFTGEIKIFSFNWAPVKWAKCDGQPLAINQNAALYSLIGTQFGGDGRNTFMLPDLRGRVPVHSGRMYHQGNFGGVESVTLVEQQIPKHFHDVNATSEIGTEIKPYDTSNPGVEDFYFAQNNKTFNLYGSASNLVDLRPSVVSETGGDQAHSNIQPSTVVNFCIALDGLYPSRN